MADENVVENPPITNLASIPIPIALSPDAALIAQRLLHTLTVYPCLSYSMIQVGLGNRYQPKDWRPVLEGLVQCGVVKRDDICLVSPIGRYQRHTRITLAPDILALCLKLLTAV